MAFTGYFMDSRFTVSLATDAGSTPHVGYFASDVGRGDFVIKHAELGGAGWQTERVTVGFEWADYAGWPSLALDRLGGVHMAWFQELDDQGEQNGPRGRYAYLARPGNGLDENCDGVDGEDGDGDGHASGSTGGDDPDDTDPSR